MKVLVLHPADARPENQGFQELLDGLNAQVVTVAIDAGHQPNLVASEPLDFEEHQRLIDAADAVIVMGGEDVVPSYYGGAATYEGQTEHVPAADAVQLDAIRYCIAQRIPLLAICRGLQLLNVACGGDLVQHMREPAVHRNEAGGDLFIEQEIWVLAGSDLVEDVPSVFLARCAHHQAVLTPGDDLQIAAVSDDGAIEALVHTHAPALGVQWHPEHPDVAQEQLPQLFVRLQRQVDARNDASRLRATKLVGVEAADATLTDAELAATDAATDTGAPALPTA